MLHVLHLAAEEVQGVLEFFPPALISAVSSTRVQLA